MRKIRLVAATALMLLPAFAAPAQTLPPGPGADITVQACTSCHGADTFTSESHDAAGWDAVVTDMIGMGAMVNDAQKKQIVDYLTTNYGPAAAPAQGAAAPPPAAAAAAPSSAT